MPDTMEINMTENECYGNIGDVIPMKNNDCYISSRSVQKQQVTYEEIDNYCTIPD